eukprot:11061032-Prorocentrum_lima.AAC.1
MDDLGRVQELFVQIELEAPLLLVGSPPCTTFSILGNFSKYKRDPLVVERAQRALVEAAGDCSF